MRNKKFMKFPPLYSFLSCNSPDSF